MWIALNNAFLSIVSDTPKSPVLKVRARAKGDIERVFPRAKVQCVAGRDYAFRAMIDRKEVAAAIAREVGGITYPNFKGSVREDDRHDAYVRLWNAMADFQEERGHGYPYYTTATGNGRPRPYRPLRKNNIDRDTFDIFD